MFIPYIHNTYKAIHDFGCESGDFLLPMKYGFFKVSLSVCLSSMIISWFALFSKESIINNRYWGTFGTRALFNVEHL